MTDCATACLQDLHSTSSIHGVVAIGGSGVTSDDTAPFVGETDITLMYSIVDIAGSNSILDSVLGNAAGAIVGMARAYQKRK